MGTLVETKATRLYKLRLFIFSAVYFLLIEAIGLFSFIYLVPCKVNLNELESIAYECVIEDCEYSVTKLQDVRDYNNKAGKKVIFKYDFGVLTKFIYEDFEELEEGLIYEGTIVVYRATFRDEVVSAMYTPVFYYEPVADNPITFNDFKLQVKEDVTKKLELESNQEYKTTLITYMLIFSIVSLLVIWIRFKLTYAAYTRKLADRKVQSLIERKG